MPTTLQWVFRNFDKRGIELESYKLEPICKYFGIEAAEGESAHDALTDVRLTAKLARVLQEAA